VVTSSPSVSSKTNLRAMPMHPGLGTSSVASLYEMVMELEPDLQSVAVGSTTLRAAMTSFVDLLVDHQGPTMLWSKLPRGENWQLELERYCKQSAEAQVAFNFFLPKEPDFPLPGQTEAEAGGQEETLLSLDLGSPELGHISLKDDQGLDWLEQSAIAPTVSIPIERGGTLSGEYFLLVTSPQFQGLILARRFKLSTPAEATTEAVPPLELEATALDMGETTAMDEDSGVAESGRAAAIRDASSSLAANSLTANSPAAARSSETRSQLRMVYTCNPVVICRVLSHIQGLLTQIPTNYLRVNLGGPVAHANHSQTTQDGSQASIAVEALLRHWGQLFTTPGALSPEMELLNQWLMKQFQRQEGLWRRLSSYRKQAEQAETHQLQHEELLNAIRLKDEFLSMVVQELRTPLTNMKTALSLLRSASLKPPQRQRYIQLLNTECDRQSSLIRGLLDLSQIEQTGDQAMQPLALSEIVPGVVSTYQSLAQEKSISLTYSIPEELPPVSCLVPWLRQVLINLLHNSVKCTGNGGRIWVRAKRQGDYLQIDVQDTGVGIAISEIPKIFNRFYRVRSQGVDDTSGAGLGLTIVQQLLLRCGGSITVNSRLGQGSTFSVLLPIYQAFLEEAS